MERRSITAFLDDFLRNGAEPMYVQRRGYRKERFTGVQVAQIAFRFARELEARGIAKGDRVMLWGENSTEWVAAFFGCVLRGAIAVPMDNAAAPNFAARVHTQVAAKLLVCSREHAGHVPRAAVLSFDQLRESLLKHSADRYEAL